MRINILKLILLVVSIVILSIEALSSPLIYTCTPYKADDTADDIRNYSICNYTLNGYSKATITASTCDGYGGNTYIKAYINGKLVASSYDGCDTFGGSLMTFTISNNTTVTIREGCYQSYSCSGTVVLSVTVSNDTCSISQPEYDALYELHNATNGPGWLKTCNNWIFPSSPNYTAPCSGWYGITCNSQCQITQILLNGCQLQGKIPLQLGNLSHTIYLSLFDNMLTGTLPFQLADMTSMQYLWLSGNSLTGTIPSQIGNMTIQQLNLGGNSLIGTIPSQLGYLFKIQFLGLQVNSLTGTIPSQLVLMSKMQSLELQGNFLSGTIPSQIGSLISMQYLSLNHNSLTGTIPSQIGLLISMQYLYLNYNSLTGTIPSQIGLLTSMQYLYLDDNSLTGTIPSQIGLLISMQQLYLDDNSLTGTIPSQIGLLTNMTGLDFSFNNISGTIPSELGSMSSMVYLRLCESRLTGTIPSELGYMTNLTYFNFRDNSLTGTIPSQFGFMTSMQSLYLFGNCLTGTIPSQFGFMTSMLSLYLYDNSLTGTIPSQLGAMISLTLLYLSSNSLTGTIPTQVTSMTSIEFFYLFGNSLTGTIPSQLGYLTSMKAIDLSSNSLSGSIPTTLHMCQHLQYCYLHDNNLVGTVPSDIMALAYLISIDLSNNRLLSGCTQTLFNNNISQTLQYIILSNMNLVGSLSDVLFQLPQLNTLVLSSNHISGTLPLSVCQSSLTSLFLDGIGTSSATWKGFHGSIPSCIFSSKLTTLHLAGNGLTGTLPAVLENSSISTLNVARNRLKGNIPLSMQTHRFTSVDMSFNKITGTLVGSFEAPSISLNMSDNRLSGSVPSTLRATTSVTLNISEGNLFGCPLLSNSDSSDYITCGSSNLNLPFLIWLTLVTIVIGFVLTTMYTTLFMNEQTKHQMLDWLQSYQYLSKLQDSSVLFHTKSTMNCLEHSCSMSLVVSLLFTLVVMMTIIGIKLSGIIHINSLYQVQYLYTVTSAFLVGVTPAVMSWLYLTLGGLIVIVLCVSIKPKLRTPRIIDSDVTIISDEEDTSKEYVEYAKVAIFRYLLAFIMVTAALAINYGFVYIVYFTRSKNLSAIQFAFAIIKAIFGTLLVPLSSKLLPKASRQSHMIVMSIMVNVIGPGIAILFTSPLCFHYRLRPSSITVSYTYPLYTLNSDGDFVKTPVVVDSTFTPQWSYSYQCSSSYLTSYLPNFIYLYTINGIVSPLVNFLVMFLLSNKYDVYLEVANLILLVIDGIQVDKIFYINESEDVSSSTQPSVEMVDGPVCNDTLSNKRVSENNISDRIIATAKKFELNVSELMPTLCVDITLMLTFGLASPLLAVVIAFSIVTNVQLFRCALGRYISIVSKSLGTGICNELLESAFGDQWRCLSSSWWIMSIFISMFWSLFIFDRYDRR